MFLVLTTFVSVIAGALAFTASGSLTAAIVAASFLGSMFFYINNVR